MYNPKNFKTAREIWNQGGFWISLWNSHILKLRPLFSVIFTKTARFAWGHGLITLSEGRTELPESWVPCLRSQGVPRSFPVPTWVTLTMPTGDKTWQVTAGGEMSCRARVSREIRSKRWMQLHLFYSKIIVGKIVIGKNLTWKYLTNLKTVTVTAESSCGQVFHSEYSRARRHQ